MRPLKCWNCGGAFEVDRDICDFCRGTFVCERCCTVCKERETTRRSTMRNVKTVMYGVGAGTVAAAGVAAAAPAVLAAGIPVVLAGGLMQAVIAATAGVTAGVAAGTAAAMVHRVVTAPKDEEDVQQNVLLREKELVTTIKDEWQQAECDENNQEEIKQWKIPCDNINSPNPQNTTCKNNASTTGGDQVIDPCTKIVKDDNEKTCKS